MDVGAPPEIAQHFNLNMNFDGAQIVHVNITTVQVCGEVKTSDGCSLLGRCRLRGTACVSRDALSLN
jgi:hypothetical protein